MSSIRKFWKKQQNAADSGRISAHGREIYGTKLTVLYVTHFMTAIMLS
jgi:hypothetical protein